VVSARSAQLVDARGGGAEPRVT